MGSYQVFLALQLTRLNFAPLLLYADPGSGTLIWQLLLASLFGAMFYIRRLKNFVLQRKQTPLSQPPKTVVDRVPGQNTEKSAQANPW
jgi:hypothetical protein